MRWLSPLFLLLLISFAAQSQKLTGIWRGYFSSSSGVYREGFKEETYKYEIQINQQSNNSLKGVTYSYKTTVFYGKAELSGIYTMASKSIILKETRLVDLKIGDKSEPCLMTCYLDYTKIGKLEVLEGSFISINIKDKGDCGSGKVYLERVTTSDFKKEDFLLKKHPADTAKVLSRLGNATGPRPVITPASPKAKSGSDNLRTSPPAVKPGSSVDTRTGKPEEKNPALAGTTKPHLPRPTLKVKTPAKAEKPPADPRVPEKTAQEPGNIKREETLAAPQQEIKKITIPRVLVERENNLVRTITTSEENILIELYDNGTIDNDTISVYHNNALAISNGKLSYSPLSIRIKCTKADSRHEITVVAENLGEIPPNTALMVIKAGKERYEIFLASNETRNAKVVINYVPKN